jgi:hypothetical protein
VSGGEGGVDWLSIFGVSVAILLVWWISRPIDAAIDPPSDHGDLDDAA